MKAYRNTQNSLPEDLTPVLVFEAKDETPYVGYHDGGIWFEAHTSEPLREVTYWMPIPLLPYQ